MKPLSEKELLSLAFSALGKRTSERKKAACRENGKKGGWHAHKANQKPVNQKIIKS